MKKRYFQVVVPLLLVPSAVLVWNYWQTPASQNRQVEPPASTIAVEALDSMPDRVDAAGKDYKKPEGKSAEGASQEEWKWKQAISNSYRVNDLILRAEMTGGQVEKETLFLDAYGQEPDNLLLNYRILEFCLLNVDSTVCGLPIENTLLRIDGDNLYTLSRLAAFRYSMGDVDTALDYLLKAQKTKVAEGYYIRTLEVIDESYRHHNFKRNTKTLTEYFGVVAAIATPSHSAISTMCNAQAEAGNTQWKQGCSNVGKALLERGTTLIDRVIGLGMQMKYSDLPEDEKNSYRESVQMRFQEDSTLLHVDHQIHPLDGLEMHIPDDVWQTFLHSYKKEGELAAFSYLYRQMEN